jgi:ribosomal protein S18 acetylase RimI-like enzyme
MIEIKVLDVLSVDQIVEAFSDSGWSKDYLKSYQQEFLSQKRFLWVAFVDGNVAGYVILKVESQYEPFARNKIPEISDLNVLPKFRRNGIATKLISLAEIKASEFSDVVGIGVGLYGGSDLGYGPAQKLYIKLGYMPDGLGVTYDYEKCIPGRSYPLDDNLVLWMKKKLR